MKQQQQQQPEERYQNLVTDYGFKTVFSKKHFLISFLNELLQGQEKIESIEYLNPHRLGKGAKDRSVIFDIHCRNDKGELLLLEMQNYHQKNFNARALFYGCHLIGEQGVKGNWDFDYKAVYVIGILNYLDHKSRDIESPVRYAGISFKDNHDTYSDKRVTASPFLPPRSA